MKTAKLCFTFSEVEEAARLGKLDALVFRELVGVYRRPDYFMPLAEDVLVAVNVFLGRHKDELPDGASRFSVMVELPSGGKAGAVTWDNMVSV